MTEKAKEQLALMKGKKYDIGLLGVWYGPNYGSVMTYYALNTMLSKMGYSVLMIDKQDMVERDFELDDNLHSRRFAKEHYENFAPSLKIDEMHLLNAFCDTFVLGCDQVWNYGIANNFGRNFYFDFVDDDKKKISYASSFGHNKSFTPMEELPEITRYLHRFDAISVREDDAVEVLKNEFGIEGTQVLDPVFMLSREEYDKVAEESQVKEEEKYMLAYILNPTPEIREMLQYVSEKKGLKLINILDGQPFRRPGFAKILDLPNMLGEITTPDWLTYIKNAECVITDSCHGASFAILFERPLVCLGNKGRGMSRFTSLANLFGINHRLFLEPDKVKENIRFLNKMDYTRIRKIIKMERKRSERWLKAALEAPKVNRKNITCVTKKECCGCGACYNSCPVDAITMEYDEEGFLYPVVHEEKCIHCGKCMRACPALHMKKDNLPVPDVYAAYGDDEIRAVSSSGGLFSLAADYVLKNGGAVCGAAFDENQKLSHEVIYDEKDLPKLRASKYVQSSTEKTYREIKKVLEEGKMALYAGCPCQIAGLRTFLGKDYEKLYTLDVLCHGGPSPVVFQKYLDEVHSGKKVVYVGFRDKDYYGWSTEMTVKYDNGEVYRRVRSEDLHYRSFLPCLSVRPHCQVCRYASLPRQGEFTLGDFWGVQKYDPKLTDGKGTSILSVNNEKGRQLLEKIKDKLVLLEPIDINYVLTHGQPFARPFKNNPRRYRFLRMIQDCTYEKTMECCADNRFEYALYGMNPDSYGDILGYYGLYKSISRMNYTVLPVRRVRENEWNITPLKYRLTAFANRYYPTVSAVDRIGKMANLNDTCRGLIAGPNTGWDEKNGALFGFVPDEEKKKIFFDKEFDGSLSPMLLNTREMFDALEKRADLPLPETYTAVYLKKGGAKLKAELEQAGCRVVVLENDMMVENWISAVKHASCVITDHMDAVNLSAVYEVPLFVVDAGDRLKNYLERLNLKGTIVASREELLTKAGHPESVSYQKAGTVIEAYRKKTLAKLEKRLFFRKPAKEVLEEAKHRAVSHAKNKLPAPVKQAIKGILKRG